MARRRHTPRQTVDDLDRAIVAALADDGRRPFTAVARDVGLSEAAVRQRYARLVDSGVLHVVPVTDPMELGFHVMALIGAKVDGGKLNIAAERIAAFGETSYVVLCTGSFDLLIEVVCKDNQHLLTFLEEQLARVPGVRDAETFLYLRLVKENYNWLTTDIVGRS